ncbi:hypothetical protein ACO0QE_001318 [Hanseniaspora vineae]
MLFGRNSRTKLTKQEASSTKKLTIVDLLAKRNISPRLKNQKKSDSRLPSNEDDPICIVSSDEEIENNTDEVQNQPKRESITYRQEIVDFTERTEIDLNGGSLQNDIHSQEILTSAEVKKAGKEGPDEMCLEQDVIDAVQDPNTNGSQKTESVSSILQNKQVRTLEVTNTSNEQDSEFMNTEAKGQLRTVDVIRQEIFARKLSSTVTRSKETTPAKPKRKRAAIPPPDHKVLFFTEEVQVAVDGFQYTCPEIKHHFLSHFHGDHYCGISKAWFNIHPTSKIYCSEITRDLTIYKFNIHEIELQERIISIPLGEYVFLQQNLRVLFFDANHCPGAILMHFEYGQQIENDTSETDFQEKITFVPEMKYLHTGDFRFDLEAMSDLLEHEYDKVYLDTTFLNYRYKFPNKNQLVESLSAFVNKNIIEKFKSKETYQNQKTLDFFMLRNLSKNNAHNKLKVCILVGAYNIGKENLIIGLCEKLGNCTLVIDDNTLRSQVDLQYEHCIRTNDYAETIVQVLQPADEVSSTTTTRSNDIVVCIVPTRDLGSITTKEMKDKYCRKVSHRFPNLQVVSIIPSGWNYTSRWSNGDDKNVEAFKPFDQSSCEQVLAHYMGIPFPFDIDSLQNVSRQKMIKFDAKYNVTTIKIPYSDHSSFLNLCEFGVYVRWKEMIPTVNLHQDEAYFAYWFDLWRMNQDKKNHARKQEPIENS